MNGSNNDFRFSGTSFMVLIVLYSRFANATFSTLMLFVFVTLNDVSALASVGRQLINTYDINLLSPIRFAIMVLYSGLILYMFVWVFQFYFVIFHCLRDEKLLDLSEGEKKVKLRNLSVTDRTRSI